MENTVLITGADRGLGFSLVKIFLENGFYVIAGQHNVKIKNLAALLTGKHHKLFIIKLDVGDDASVKKAYKKIIGITDTLDVIINNAAILGDTSQTIEQKLYFDEISRVININTLGPLRTANAFYTLLMKSKYRLLVNISSEAGSIGQCTRNAWLGYCMSKAALNMQSNLLHNFIHEKGGQVIVIHPGWMKTYLKGKKDEEAELEPDYSAAKIFGIINDREKFKADKPAFIDINQNIQVW